ncbi:uncharacterized protein EHS24_001257 [Apiotrichum porosum]|uniref:Uncharacterized protein n=1 Tax=Apiotrichum porosum TaxID=105984 RepID=A0A427XK63_9TREE|nr:uncharacterized protein EHS24_001257 [Apiotrichum porosum]RSH79218.1 hypothetical protein EHS24_001257 [Apiotrichum porosum]
MRGAFVGTSRPEVIDCPMLLDTGRCRKYRKRYDEDGVVDAYGDSADDRILDPLFSEMLAEGGENVDEEEEEEDEEEDEDEEEEDAHDYEYEDNALGVMDDTRRRPVSKIVEQVQVTNSSKPTTNFKAKLLSYVRVLTIRNHHACQCHTYGADAAKLFTGLDTLRTAPEYVETVKLMPVCDGDRHLCPFFTNLAPRKVVIRNIDCTGAPLPPWREHEWKMPATLEEVVFFLPTNGWRYIAEFEELGTDLFRLGAVFETAPAVKVVFYSHWETWMKGYGKGGDKIYVDPDFVIYTVRYMAQFDRTRKVYGLETIHWAQRGEMVDVFRRHRPHEHLDNTRLCKLVRDELRTGDLAIAMQENDGTLELHELPDVIEYGTLKEYMADEEGRRHEINADD